MSVSFRQSWGERVQVSMSGQAGSVTYRYDAALPKACIHPLLTPQGRCLSGFEMSDHVWHRGLWFAIKFVNGTNFWEEKAPFGIQTSRAEPACALSSADAVRVSHAVEWASEATDVVLRETRAITIRFISEEIGAIDWTTELHAAQDLTLDRTPYTTWGGYGGLAFRAARELHDARFLLPGGEVVAGLAGQPHEWVVMEAKVDGGPDRRVSLGIVDHPANPRSPSPWYCKSGNGFTYLNPALLFHEPMKLDNGERLRLRYRVLYRDGLWEHGEFAELARAFRATEDGQ